MESYKHSCPFCGQHIEYTAGYCGKQMVCPICGKTVTFPAIPPGKRQSAHAKDPVAARIPKWVVDLKGIFPVLSRFEHWNLVLVSLVPILIVGALLIGAAVVKKEFGSEPARPVVPAVQADPNAWQKMTQLARAEQVVQEQLAEVNQAKAAATAAERNLARLQALYQGKSPEQLAASARQMQAAQQAVAGAQKTLANDRQSFENAFQIYRNLGGTIDYHRQLTQ